MCWKNIFNFKIERGEIENSYVFFQKKKKVGGLLEKKIYKYIGVEKRICQELGEVVQWVRFLVDTREDRIVVNIFIMEWEVDREVCGLVSLVYKVVRRLFRRR